MSLVVTLSRRKEKVLKGEFSTRYRLFFDAFFFLIGLGKQGHETKKRSGTPEGKKELGSFLGDRPLARGNFTEKFQIMEGKERNSGGFEIQGNVRVKFRRVEGAGDNTERSFAGRGHFSFPTIMMITFSY
jgi:hypothetical protein